MKGRIGEVDFQITSKGLGGVVHRKNEETVRGNLGYRMKCSKVSLPPEIHASEVLWIGGSAHEEGDVSSGTKCAKSALRRSPCSQSAAPNAAHATG